MTRYAETTTVSSDRSRAEIERTLTRYGANQFAYAWSEHGEAMVGFTLEHRNVRFVLALPNRTDRIFTHTPSRGTPRTREAADRAYEQAVRQRWRALALIVRAKLEAVEAGITSFEEEFLAHICLPGGQTVGQMVLPEIAQAYELSEAPLRLLADLGKRSD